MTLRHSWLNGTLIAVLSMVALFASCDMGGLRDIESTNTDSRALSTNTVAYGIDPAMLPKKIVGTAGIGADAFFFEFDVTGTQKFVRVFLPVSPDGFLKNNQILYRKERYRLNSLGIGPAPAAYPGFLSIMGQTEAVAGVSYAFQGLYSRETGFFGNIQRMDKGVVLGGEYDFLGGLPIFDQNEVENYIGFATFHFDSDTTALIFSALINSSGTISGTWCETKPGLGNIHGTIGGSRDGASVRFTGNVLDMYKAIPGLYLDTMSAEGAGWYKNPGEKTISGQFTINWVGSVWPSDFVAVRLNE